MKLRTNYSDFLGIGSAFLCLIHCLATPLLLGFGATFTGQGHHHAEELGFFFHHAWDYLFLTLGFIAVYISARQTTSRLIRLLLWTSLSFLAGMILLGEYISIFQYLALLASLILIFTHLANLRQMFRKVPQTSVGCNC